MIDSRVKSASGLPINWSNCWSRLPRIPFALVCWPPAPHRGFIFQLWWPQTKSSTLRSGHYQCYSSSKFTCFSASVKKSVSWTETNGTTTSRLTP